MSSNSTGTFRDTDVADYLEDVRKEQAANKFGKTGDNALTPHTIMPQVDDMTVEDDALVNDTEQVLNDTTTISDTLQANDLGLNFVVTDNDGNVPHDQPIKMEFWIIGDNS